MTPPAPGRRAAPGSARDRPPLTAAGHRAPRWRPGSLSGCRARPPRRGEPRLASAVAPRRLCTTVALVAALAAPATAAVRAGAGFTTGQWRDGGEPIRINGGRAFVEWSADAWCLSATFRGLSQRPGDAGDGRPRPRGRSLTGAILAGYDLPWIHVALGAAFADPLLFDDGPRLLPAAALRLGPKPLHLNASVFDLTPRSPGPGLARAGLGARISTVRLWTGWAWDEHGDGAALATALPLSDRLDFWVDAALDPRRPSAFLQLEAGVTLRFGDPPGR